MPTTLTMPSATAHIVAFLTELGWVSLVHSRETILRTSVGHRSERSALRAMREFAARARRPDTREQRWIELFRDYAAGNTVSFQSLKIDQSWMTDFQQRVIEACRSIAYGQTLSYGQVAQLAGSPRASRAVGSTMAKNRCPLIVPCHRVVGSTGIGGFSGPDGVNLKQRLLELEGACWNGEAQPSYRNRQNSNEKSVGD